MSFSYQVFLPGEKNYINYDKDVPSYSDADETMVMCDLIV